ncbi:hypothetical protein A3C20_03285 [Candidatus Kaiserbacteria bacterium RIFCSPHIGHO2_02_FULL_55_25]|uniref:Uncharacterized protein n=1 Tax=Candidatus Kaiserbacteria bacterium RIFCSPHIGHO2_02_FULL_55_25 TaxID=1798498 RepID=A0A1F6E6T0_9BACT|nr:MAG: hypothetical protein A3C20_03285 [Candidatus Kaiserbacteria bacterium RIFCSPHIGHO2_02_FULL_55_25]OGG83922.1 MAG: hypothetical protein A3A42_00290 [Candidatus Kaiserbacteria bacterium RIFCSPLOWO2_01_FULL_55_25]
MRHATRTIRKFVRPEILRFRYQLDALVRRLTFIQGKIIRYQVNRNDGSVSIYEGGFSGEIIAIVRLADECRNSMKAVVQTNLPVMRKPDFIKDLNPLEVSFERLPW